MNTHIFDNHYLTCPICQKNAARKPMKACIGLFSCPYCQERLVVCQSGHYVRDPFSYKQQVAVSSSLRRQSRPLARILRDFVILKHPLVALVVGSAILLGALGITQQQTTTYDTPELPKTEKQL
ncbi:hypothetical protein F7734_11335 [Scytonema sp. UIC 10036]|uniref:hypothetical protein n=1 Tax=Scytonema sp. UIC 10036 TaxID=2304196 RepID=UPI0012DA4096|nr:hypothetical protein [Scytonema sp. UIC 10036]MUG92996.1 hypothetical protein [Scytonema sp. UIC 10036]